MARVSVHLGMRNLVSRHARILMISVREIDTQCFDCIAFQNYSTTFPPFIALLVIQKLLYNGNNETPQRPLHDHTSNFHQRQSEPSSSILKPRTIRPARVDDTSHTSAPNGRTKPAIFHGPVPQANQPFAGIFASGTATSPISVGTLTLGKSTGMAGSLTTGPTPPAAQVSTGPSALAVRSAVRSSDTDTPQAATLS